MSGLHKPDPFPWLWPEDSNEKMAEWLRNYAASDYTYHQHLNIIAARLISDGDANRFNKKLLIGSLLITTLASAVAIFLMSFFYFDN